MAATEMQTVELTPAVAESVQHEMHRGGFASVSDFLERAVDTWKDTQPLENVEYLRQCLAEAREQEGPYLTLEEVFDPIEARLQAMIDAEERKKH